MQFNFSYSQGVSQIQMTAFEFAGKVWSSYLTDNVTVNIAVDLQSVFPNNNIIAGSVARANENQYSIFKQALGYDVSSSIDSAAINSNADVFRSYFKADVQNIDPFNQNKLVDSSQIGTMVELNSANAKALKLAPLNTQSILDGYVVMRDLTGQQTTWDYNFSRTNTTPSNTIDFIGVALHEIGHILGFQSSVDQPWEDPSSYLYSSNATIRPDIATPLDLFRYSSRGGKYQVDLSPGSNPFFSLDGTNSLGSFQKGSNAKLGGNGLQASHWALGGIMNAEIKKGAVAAISQQDLNAFNVIGWDINPQGISSALNYSQLYAQAQQSANTKTKQDISSALGLMLDSSDIYLPLNSDPSNPTNARSGSWWQETFARSTNWWQQFSQVVSNQSVFETLDEGLGESSSASNPETTVPNSDTNPLTGKADDKALVGETGDASYFSANNAQSSSLDFFSTAIAQPTFNNDFDITAIAPISSVLSNIMSFGNKDNFQVAASTSDNFKLDDSRSFAPWWLSEGALWAVH
jgi:hypothetical protein